MAELKTMYDGVTNSPDTFLTSALASEGTVLYVADGSVFGTLPNLVVLGSGANAETILVIDKRTDNGYNIQRAVEGLARDWPQATIAARNFTNKDYTTLIENVQALNIGKVEIVTGKGLSKNDYTDAEKNKLAGIESGAQVNTVTSVNGQTGAVITPDTTYGLVTTTANGLMASTDKVKLNGIAANANNYVHPSAHPATMITQDSNNRFVTDVEKQAWNGKQNALTAGENITIENNVISATGAGSDVTIVSQYDVPKENGFTGFLRVYLFSNGWKYFYAVNLTRSTASLGVIAGTVPEEYKPLLQNNTYFTGLHRPSSGAYTPVNIYFSNVKINVNNPNAGGSGIICTGFYL